MKKIIIKEIDKFKSSVFDEKYISEYLIYLVDNSNEQITYLKAFTEIGENNKNNRINSLKEEFFKGIEENIIL